MPIAVDLDSDSLVLTIVASGPFGMAEIEAIQAATQEHARSAALAGMVVDLRGVTETDITSRSVRVAASRARAFEVTQGLRMAIVADSEVAFGLSRMYELMRDEDGSVRVVRDSDTAKAWLERPGVAD